MNTTEIRELNTAELDLVSGGTKWSFFKFEVGGVRVFGYGNSDGQYGVTVGYGDDHGTTVKGKITTT